MVSKSYVVNECSKVIHDDDTSLTRMTKIDRYILQISNEMVKMKPSNIFGDDNSSSSTSYWNKKSLVEWNRERMSAKSFALLVKIVIFCLLLVGFGILTFTWTHPNSLSPTSRHSINTDHSSIISNLKSNLSIMNSSTTEESTKINSLQKASTNVIYRGDVHDEKKPNDGTLLTKKYVERINFYTTSNLNLFSAKVSPTLPTINKHDPTSELPTESYANDNSCQSTSLPLCQGVLSYDLTDPRSKWNLTNVEYQHFQHLLGSKCSKRVAEFVCHMLEPECRPSRMKNLKPCRRICKGIFESCSHIIASSAALTEFFDCHTYVDSFDHSACEDITRYSNKCFDDEFKCDDSSCIPAKWRCDNIRDCSNGEDEDGCKFCNYDEFKCITDESCISDKWFCDGVEDCIDGSDEASCNIEESEEEEEGDEQPILLFDDKDYDQTSYDQQDHTDSDGDRIVSTGTGDGVVPIFVNPNATSSTSQPPTTVKTPKRFRSTTRNSKPATTQKPPEETTTIKQKNEIVKASTSHSSPCPEFELRCVDGLCITLDQICDKIQDCSDNSDELHCEYDN